VAAHIRVVGDEHDGDALAVELLKEREDFHRRAAVERAGGLVRQQEGRGVDQRPRDGDALLLAAESCIGR
jgi:hypothetical protein